MASSQRTIVVLDIKPYEAAADLEALAARILALEIPGVQWFPEIPEYVPLETDGDRRRIIPIGYGVSKLRLSCIIEDGMLEAEELGETIEDTDADEVVQSVDIAELVPCEVGEGGGGGGGADAAAGTEGIAATMARLEEADAATAATRALLPPVPRNLQPLQPCSLEEGVSAAVDTLRSDGAVRLNGVLAPELAERCLEQIEAQLLAQTEAAEAAAAGTAGKSFGNVYARKCRYDMYLQNEDAYRQALCSMLGEGGALGGLFSALFGGLPCVFHELSALVSDSGSAEQPIHPDSKWTANPILYTCFIALQDVEEPMGPTLCIPGTNTQASHKAHTVTEDSKREFLERSEYRQALLRKGDVMVMDSRTLHCGGANCSGCLEAEGGSGGGEAKRRVLLYFTLRSPLHSMDEDEEYSAAMGGASMGDADYPSDGSLHEMYHGATFLSTADFA